MEKVKITVLAIICSFISLGYGHYLGSQSYIDNAVKQAYMDFYSCQGLSGDFETCQDILFTELNRIF